MVLHTTQSLSQVRFCLSSKLIYGNGRVELKCSYEMCERVTEEQANTTQHVIISISFSLPPLKEMFSIPSHLSLYMNEIPTLEGLF